MDVFNNLKYKLSNSFPALRHKNFRYFWFGQCVSLVGTWMQNMAQPWLIYSLTKSAFLLGLVGALQFTPMLLFSLFAGVFVDKLPKRKIVICTQFIAMTQAAILAVLVYTGHVQYWHVLILAAVLGFVNTVDMPARQSFMIELVGKEDLTNAVGLNSSVFNAARIIGPAVAGLIMGYFGIAFCFLLNALSFGAVIIGLFHIDSAPVIKKGNAGKNVIRDIKDGLGYASRERVIFRTLLLVTIIGIFGMNFSVLIPVFAKSVLNQQETGFGLLMSSMGIGSFLGAISVAARSKSEPRRLVLYSCSIAASLLLIAIGYSSRYFITAGLLVFTGFFITMFSTTALSTIQYSTNDEYRGRIMSLYSLVFGGTTPLGNLFAGSVANSYGARISFIASGGVILVLMVALLLIMGKTKVAGNRS